jgi:hypothetical protein
VRDIIKVIKKYNIKVNKRVGGSKIKTIKDIKAYIKHLRFS